MSKRKHDLTAATNTKLPGSQLVQPSSGRWRGGALSSALVHTQPTGGDAVVVSPCTNNQNNSGRFKPISTNGDNLWGYCSIHKTVTSGRM